MNATHESRHYVLRVEIPRALVKPLLDYQNFAGLHEELLLLVAISKATRKRKDFQRFVEHAKHERVDRLIVEALVRLLAEDKKFTKAQLEDLVRA